MATKPQETLRSRPPSTLSSLTSYFPVVREEFRPFRTLKDLTRERQAALSPERRRRRNQQVLARQVEEQGHRKRKLCSQQVLAGQMKQQVHTGDW
ncbi:unnamed protein product [Arctogadus glacialis]